MFEWEIGFVLAWDVIERINLMSFLCVKMR